MNNIKSLLGLALSIALLAQGSLARADGEGLAVGNGKAKFNGLLQAWTLNDTTATTGAKFNFRLRRAELKFSGSVAENTRWFVMVDAAKSPSVGTVATSDNKILQDLGVAFKLTPELELIAGQFKTPTTSEGLDPSAELLLPERAYVSRTYGDRREPGVMLVYEEAMWKASLMAHNGQPTNVNDTNSDKDLSLRLDVTPIEGLKVGAFTTAGDMKYENKARFGGNAKFVLEKLLLRAEIVHARDAAAKTTGFYVDGGYEVTPKLQGVVRFESIDNNSVFTSSVATLGVNYFVSKHGAKIQAAASMLNDMTGNSGTYTPPKAGSDGSLFILSFQAGI